MVLSFPTINKVGKNGYYTGLWKIKAIWVWP